jgi:hypothetical protein
VLKDVFIVMYLLANLDSEILEKPIGDVGRENIFQENFIDALHRFNFFLLHLVKYICTG